MRFNEYREYTILDEMEDNIKDKIKKRECDDLIEAIKKTISELDDEEFMEFISYFAKREYLEDEYFDNFTEHFSHQCNDFIDKFNNIKDVKKVVYKKNQLDIEPEMDDLDIKDLVFAKLYRDYDVDAIDFNMGIKRDNIIVDNIEWDI